VRELSVRSHPVYDGPSSKVETPTFVPLFCHPVADCYRDPIAESPSHAYQDIGKSLAFPYRSPFATSFRQRRATNACLCPHGPDCSTSRPLQTGTGTASITVSISFSATATRTAAPTGSGTGTASVTVSGSGSNSASITSTASITASSSGVRADR